MAFSDSFVSSFEKVLPTATASGASAASDAMKEKIKRETESAEKATRLANIKNLASKQVDLLKQNPDIEENIKKFAEEQFVLNAEYKDPDMAEAHFKSTVSFINDIMKKNVSEKDPVAKSISNWQAVKKQAQDNRDEETLDFANKKIAELNQSQKSSQEPTSNIVDEKQGGSQEQASQVSPPLDKTIPGDVAKKQDSTTKVEPSKIKENLTPDSYYRTASQKIADFKEVYDKFGNRLRSNILEEEALKLEVKQEIEAFKEKHKLEKSEDITLMETFRFMQQFDRSEEELRSFDPNFDKEGYEGWIIRRGAEVANYFDELPETKALRIKILPMANAMAREIEGGKVTDSDREIYANEFADAIKNPSATNVRLLSSRYLNIIDKYGNTDGSIPRQLRLLSKSGAPSMRRMVAQVVEEYPELAQEIYGEDFEVIE